MIGLLVAGAVIALAAGVGLVWRRRDGRLRAGAGELPAGLVDPSAAAATLIQFSSVTCAPCRQLRAVCADLAAGTEGVRHVEVDADERLDAVRELGIWRVPALLLVDRRGHVAWRTTGVPDRATLAAAVNGILVGA